jgi:hypothetical protein
MLIVCLRDIFFYRIAFRCLWRSEIVEMVGSFLGRFHKTVVESRLSSTCELVMLATELCGRQQR